MILAATIKELVGVDFPATQKSTVANMGNNRHISYVMLPAHDFTKLFSRELHLIDLRT